LLVADGGAVYGLLGAGTLTARLVLSGKSYTASLVGADQEANLALLQLPGTGFAPVAIGTAAGLSLDDRVASGNAVPVDDALQLARQLAGQ
jgi:S1-C subfamily serine protease